MMSGRDGKRVTDQNLVKARKRVQVRMKGSISFGGHSKGLLDLNSRETLERGARDSGVGLLTGSIITEAFKLHSGAAHWHAPAVRVVVG
jgi:hypothetical protein